MQLVYTETQTPVQVGDITSTFRGEDVTVTYFRPPHKPASSGKISVKDENDRTAEYYVGVIGAEWINREDR